MPGFPRLYAAASLKLQPHVDLGRGVHAFSAALCRGLIEAKSRRIPNVRPWSRFPRLYAAASLKPE